MAQHTLALDNHYWILFLYSLASGEVLCGFGYVDVPIACMLDRETLLEFTSSWGTWLRSILA